MAGDIRRAMMRRTLIFGLLLLAGIVGADARFAVNQLTGFGVAPTEEGCTFDNRFLLTGGSIVVSGWNTNSSAAFDGNRVQTRAQSASGASPGYPAPGKYIGKNWSGAETYTVFEFRYYCPSDGGCATNPGTATLYLEGSNNGSSWTTLSTKTETDFHSANSNGIYTTGITTTTAYGYHRFRAVHTSGDSTGYITEVEFYGC